MLLLHMACVNAPLGTFQAQFRGVCAQRAPQHSLQPCPWCLIAPAISAKLLPPSLPLSLQPCGAFGLAAAEERGGGAATKF